MPILKKPDMNKAEFLDQLASKLIDRVQAKSATGQQLQEEIAALLKESMYPEVIEKTQEVTILLSDIRGFTAISERYTASQILQMLNLYFSYMNPIILKYGGMIDKYMGDAILVVFGEPSASPEDALNAVACAIEMQLAMDTVNHHNKTLGFPEIFAGIGLNTDTVSSGQLGTDIHNEFTVIGDGVNLASRIESHSLRGQILISQYTWERVKDAVQIGQVNQVQVKGKSQAVELLEVTSIDYHGLRLEVPRREVRSCIRLEMNTPFEFQLIKGKQVLPDYLQGTIRDLSYNGLFATANEAIAPLTNIRFTLSLNLLGGKPRDIYAKIVSARELQAGEYGYGIEFTMLDEESQQSIKNFIDRIISGK